MRFFTKINKRKIDKIKRLYRIYKNNMISWWVKLVCTVQVGNDQQKYSTKKRNTGFQLLFYSRLKSIVTKCR